MGKFDRYLSNFVDKNMIRKRKKLVKKISRIPYIYATAYHTSNIRHRIKHVPRKNKEIKKIVQQFIYVYIRI